MQRLRDTFFEARLDSGLNREGLRDGVQVISPVAVVAKCNMDVDVADFRDVVQQGVPGLGRRAGEIDAASLISGT